METHHKEDPSLTPLGRSSSASGAASPLTVPQLLISRRRFITGTAALAIGTAIGVDQAIHRTSFGAVNHQASELLAGIIEHIDGSRDLIMTSLLNPRDPTIRVSVLASATLWHHVTSLDDAVIPGMEVLAQGSWDAGRFVAHELEPMLYRVTGTVLQVIADTIQTSAGSFRTDWYTAVLPFHSTDDIDTVGMDAVKPGHSIVALYWNNPVTTEPTATMLFVDAEAVH